MWISIEIPDEAEPQVRETLEWLNSTEYLLSSTGAAALVVVPGEPVVMPRECSGPRMGVPLLGMRIDDEKPRCAACGRLLACLPRHAASA